MSKLLSFLGGMGTGALSQYEKNLSRDRQDRIDVQNQQLFDARMEDINRVKSDREALAVAGRQAVVEEGAGGMLKPETMDNRDVGLPENAALPNQGLSDKSFRVNKQNYATQAEADAAKAAYDAPDASARRTVQALRATGRASEAMQMEAAAKAGKMSDIQLKAAQVKEADDAFNAKAMERFRKIGAFPAAAEMMTETNALGMAGVKYEAAPSTDGKTMEFYRTDAEGARTLAHQVPNNKEGEESVMTSAFKLSPEKKMDWYRDSIKLATEAARHKQTFDRQGTQWTATHDQRAKEIRQNYELAVKSAGESGEAAAMNLKVATLSYNRAVDENKVPPVVMKMVDSLREQIKIDSTALAKSQAEGNWRAEDLGTKALTDRVGVASKKLNELLTPYMPVTKGIPKPQANPQAEPGRPPGLVVGAPAKERDGTYPTKWGQVTIKDKKITEIK